MPDPAVRTSLLPVAGSIVDALVSWPSEKVAVPSEPITTSDRPRAVRRFLPGPPMIRSFPEPPVIASAPPFVGYVLLTATIDPEEYVAIPLAPSSTSVPEPPVIVLFPRAAHDHARSRCRRGSCRRRRPSGWSWRRS